MTEQCVIHAGNSQFMEYVGNVLSAITMTYAQSAIILISIICVIDFIGSRKDMSHCGILKEFCKRKKTKKLFRGFVARSKSLRDIIAAFFCVVCAFIDVKGVSAKKK